MAWVARMACVAMNLARAVENPENHDAKRAAHDGAGEHRDHSDHSSSRHDAPVANGRVRSAEPPQRATGSLTRRGYSAHKAESQYDEYLRVLESPLHGFKWPLPLVRCLGIGRQGAIALLMYFDAKRPKLWP